jgi:peptidyl-prolyl cis-trans isomerase B (cyclophilin B)
VPTAKQKRQAAQRHLQRQLERRAELARKRRRNLGILATVVVVAVVVTAIVLLNNVGGDDDSTAAEPTDTGAATSAAAAPAAASTNPDGTVACDFAPDTSGNPNLTDVGTPPDAAMVAGTGTSTLVMSTNHGDLTLTLDRTKAPCAAASFTYLAEQKFFDGSTCHREVNEPTFGVLQCGDPTGTGSGGPTYKFAEEVTAETAYPRGTIAMAKSSDPGTTGSQFFLVFTDTQLPPEYTVVGTIDEAGLAILDEIAKTGNDGTSPAGGGAPNTPVEVESITVAA